MLLTPDPRESMEMLRQTIGPETIYIEQDRDWCTDPEGKVVAQWRGAPKGCKWYPQIASNGFEGH